MSSFQCQECEESVLKSQKKSHKQEYHSKRCDISFEESGETKSIGIDRKNGIFSCTHCAATYPTTSGIRMHFIRKHATSKNAGSQPNFEFECSHCKSVFLSVESLDEHLDVHSEIYEEEPADDNNIQESQASSLLSQTKIKLNEATHDHRTTDYILEYVVPYRVRTNGRELMAFLTPGEAEQVSKDPIEGWLRIDQGKAPMEVDPRNLETLLTSHRFGSIIDVKHYSPMDPELFMKPFRPNKDDIAKRLAGSIIQTGTQVILVLKAEIYGRRPSDDPHEFALVMPSYDVKRISIVFHDNSRKLVVGTNTWSSLITASIELTSGTIEVGASNSTVNIARTSLIWCRDDYNQNLLVERQLRSKFDKSQTYWDCAAVFFLFSDWRCQPATIFQIVNYYYSKKMSGIKAAAVIFNGLLSSSIIKKSSLEELRTQLRNNKLSAGSVALQIIEKLILSFPADEAELDVINNETTKSKLRALADSLCDAIRVTNDEKVKLAIQEKVIALIQSKE